MSPLIDRSGGALCEPVSVCNRTGLCPTEMEIGKWRAETGARNPPRKDRNTKNCRSEAGARQPNPRECRGFPPTGKLLRMAESKSAALLRDVVSIRPMHLTGSLFP